MPTYKSPGVYVEELSAFPPSVAPVSTAVPAFLGYTEMAVSASGASLTKVPTRISTFMDYQSLFGGPPVTGYTVKVKANTGSDGKTPDGTYSIDRIDPSGGASLLYYAVQHYFQNGGGPCYIVSVGPSSTTTASKDDFDQGLAALAAEDEPTLIVSPDATKLSPDTDGYFGVCNSMLQQCGQLADRFAIMDLLDSDLDSNSPGTDFRTAVTGSLDRGAAYTPFLHTSIQEMDAAHFDPALVNVSGLDEQSQVLHAALYSYEQQGCIVVSNTSPANVIITTDKQNEGDTNITFGVAAAVPGDTPTPLTLTIYNVGATVSGKLPKGGGKSITTVIGSQIVGAWAVWSAGKNSVTDLMGFTLAESAPGTSQVTQVALTDPQSTLTQPTVQTPVSSGTLDKLAGTPMYGALYSQICSAILARTVTLPPSAAVAGVYCTVDGTRGVWKAPANVGLLAVSGPTRKITNEVQDGLNVDGTGKSINAIRVFTGQGTLIWGARTLLGNDNNWRYISVRRLFIFIEESVQQSTSWAVFEPNVMTTWLKVKASIEGFLYGLWQQGALVGSKPQDAYFVNVGLGTTMTQQDVLNGYLKVTVGAAPSRPAEFIVLTFTQKLQQ